ncbi:hypothetical protein SPRG_18819 [Saprolegnia parasitica CBS 223.65]|uniref:Uncharacterized protein n=1 Tax=Saprolegnia parasitica (strain CBS 223.65) TaxID=695850 RepID=A0A067D9I7_SAPPC|nr:hypothetical protein SPRG_18819 [Saprolegnia parasitica CBS 223.65]KDO35657.1 hypothetical protein SPRG_18819 [Saprolegnia parasitica CBS 223.65]|eukprot:XP_012194036.1 hypothetical protein SPRG_18819 [Saprolegnia parasitica CBS 223.65]
MVHVKVVLLCKGRGGDAASYQPHRDESQWWNRRDALVRCVSAFLHGPSSAYCTSRELVLVHDEDWARMHVTKGDATPSEFNVVNAWRETAQHAKASSASSAVACKLVQSALSIAGADTVAAMESKREVLEHLQKHCDMDFLRGHRLNSKPDVVLRKTNKQALLRVWDEWTATHGTTAASKKDVVNAIFHDMLQPRDASIKRVIAATLHESSDAELPCFNTDLAPTDDPSLQIVLFLGAVRDMTPTENNILQQLCATQNISLTGVRLGAVPEFTSKILSVIAYHQARGVLGPALERACAVETEAPPAKRQKTTAEATSVPVHMHVVAAVPMASSGVSTDLGSRSQALWAMVRLLVVTLWRSRIASSGEVPLTTALTFVFEDAVALTLKQDELVTALAEQHQAAPCEYQILRALCQYLAAATPDADVATMASRLVEGSTMAIDVSNAAAERGLYEAFYTTEAIASAGDAMRLLVLVPLAPTHAGHDAVVAACAHGGVPLVSQSLLPSPEMVPVHDAEAATVTMLQHLLYQQRLGSALASLAPTKQPKKAKKTKKEKKTKKSKTQAIDSTGAKP